MTINDRDLRRYLRQVRGWLPCGGKLKKQIMGQIEDRVRDFLEHNPDADLTRLQAEFGTPQAIAAAYVDNTDTAEILKSLRVRRRIVAIVAITMAVILISWAAAVTWTIIDYSNSTDTPHIEVAIGK